MRESADVPAVRGTHTAGGLGRLVVLGLWAWMACQGAAAAPGAPDESASSIDTYAEKVDDQARVTPYDSWTRARGGDWHLNALGRPPDVLYLEAKVQLGSYVRNERYYFRDGKLVMARVNESWDMNSQAAEPGKPHSRTYRLSGDAPLRWLQARARTLLAALADPRDLGDRLSDLEEFPWDGGKP